MKNTKFFMRTISTLCVVGFLSACTSAAPEQSFPKRYAVGGAYTVKGHTYRPKRVFYYKKVGVASWYGPGFLGKKTADGEIYNMNLLTAAHKTLPLPSMVRVTNLSNHRSVVLRVNDRGPFVGDRLIDVSKKAAKLLGFEKKGTARVEVLYLGPAPLDPRKLKHKKPSLWKIADF